MIGTVRNAASDTHGSARGTCEAFASASLRERSVFDALIAAFGEANRLCLTRPLPPAASEKLHCGCRLDGRAGAARPVLRGLACGDFPHPSLADAKAIFPHVAGEGARPDRAVVSLWTQYYFSALIAPVVTALLCWDCELPVALDESFFELDDHCRPARFVIASPVRRRRPDDAPPAYVRLVQGHLTPFIDLCAGHVGLPRRVLWGNAAVILDATVRRLTRIGPVVPAALAEVEALLDCRETPLGRALTSNTPDGCRGRRVCCLRERLPGVADCGALCPIVRRGAPRC